MSLGSGPTEDAQEAWLRGELRRLPRSLGWRILQALSLWTFIASSLTLLSRLTLGYRHRFELRSTERDLVLLHERIVFGRSIRTARTVLPLERLQEITLEKSGEPPTFAAGLAALALGTFVGFRFFAEGLFAPGVAPSLLGLGLLLVVAGLAFDFFVGSGRTGKSLEGRPEVTLRLTRERGWVLTSKDSLGAEKFLAAVQRALATGQDLARPGDLDLEPERAPEEPPAEAPAQEEAPLEAEAPQE